MWDDLTKSVKAQLYERASSPLFGSFVLAWSCWNYRLIFILLTAGDAEKKLAYIDSNIYVDYWSFILHAFLGPASSAVVFIYCYPLVSKSIYKYWQNQQKELKKIQQDIEDETPLTQEEARQLRFDLRQAAVDFDKKFSDKEKQIEDLNELLKEKQDEMDTLKSSIPPASPMYPAAPSETKINEGQFNILENLALKSLRGIPFDTLITISGPDAVKTEADIDRLQTMSYASEFRAENGERTIRITPQGRERFLKERENDNELRKTDFKRADASY